MSADPLVVRPRRLRRVCHATAAVVALVFAALALVLPRGSSGGQPFGIVDQVLFFLTGLLLASPVVAFTRFRVRADDTGVWVRNAWADRYYPWGVVAGVAMGPNAPWAELVLHDDERVALLAVQAHDGPHAERALAALRSRRPGTDGSLGP